MRCGRLAGAQAGERGRLNSHDGEEDETDSADAEAVVILHDEGDGAE